MSRIHPHIRAIYGFLKKYKMESFARFYTDEIEGVLITYELLNHWYRFKENEWTSISIMNPFTGNRNKLDNSVMSIQHSN